MNKYRQGTSPFGPVVKALFPMPGHGFQPWFEELKISHAPLCGQKKKKNPKIKIKIDSLVCKCVCVCIGKIFFLLQRKNNGLQLMYDFFFKLLILQGRFQKLKKFPVRRLFDH